MVIQDILIEDPYGGAEGGYLGDSFRLVMSYQFLAINPVFMDMKRSAHQCV